MNSTSGLSLGSVLSALALCPTVFAQDALTLEEALRLARERNGVVQAAFFDVESARSRVRSATGAFLPTVTPVFRYNSDRRQTIGGFIQDEGSSSAVSANWRVLDSGERYYSLMATRSNREAEEASARQTLRDTLFDVHQRFVDTLRAQELQKVADAQYDRANKILEQTKFQVEVGDVAQKDILQAQADALNARVQQLTARNRTQTNQAFLKSTIGWEVGRPLPPLSPVGEPDVPALPPLQDVLSEGLQNRADLISRRAGLTTLRFNRLRADREAGVTFGVDANFDQQVTPRSLESRSLSLVVSYPLFDGNRSREAARQARLTELAAQSLYAQAERQVSSEIESAYAQVSQNVERIQAARSALEAAKLNYRAVSESQTAGASDLLQVLTAQVSLVTAESNYIEALYDLILSDVELRLAMGRPLPGESGG